MDFAELVKTRRSTREFLTKIEISESTIEDIIRTAQLAPSAGNLQSYKIKVLRTVEEMKQVYGFCYNQRRDFFSESVLIFIVFADQEQSNSRYPNRSNLYAVQDATLFASYLQLATVNLGFATNWVGSFDEEMIKQIYCTSLQPVSIITVGVTDNFIERPARRNISEIMLL